VRTLADVSLERIRYGLLHDLERLGLDKPIRGDTSEVELILRRKYRDSCVLALLGFLEKRQKVSRADMIAEGWRLRSIRYYEGLLADAGISINAPAAMLTLPALTPFLEPARVLDEAGLEVRKLSQSPSDTLGESGKSQDIRAPAWQGSGGEAHAGLVRSGQACGQIKHRCRAKGSANTSGSRGCNGLAQRPAAPTRGPAGPGPRSAQWRRASGSAVGRSGPRPQIDATQCRIKGYARGPPFLRAYVQGDSRPVTPQGDGASPMVNAVAWIETSAGPGKPVGAVRPLVTVEVRAKHK
jgi:hypothetical protein